MRLQLCSRRLWFGTFSADN